MTAPEVGMLAEHKSGDLDPRPVAAVTPNGQWVKLEIFGTDTPWLPAGNYEFTEAPA